MIWQKQKNNKMKNQQRINCIKLMLGILDTPPPKFDMGNWAVAAAGIIGLERLYEQVQKDPNVCGTTCCFLGAGVVFGIGGDLSKLQCNDWGYYAEHVFGIDSATHTFLFKPRWPSIPEQAAARMQIYLRASEDERNERYDKQFHREEGRLIGNFNYHDTFPELTEDDITGWTEEQLQLEKAS